MPVSRIYGEGEDFDVSELTTYLTKDSSIANKVVLQQGSRKITNEFGATVLTRQFRCHRDVSLRLEPRVGDVDFLHKGLEYWDHEVEYEAAHALINVKFNGILDEVGQSGPTKKIHRVE